MKRFAFGLSWLSASALLFAHSSFAVPATQDALVHLEWRATPEATLDVSMSHAFGSSFTALEDILDGETTALEPPPLRWNTKEVYKWRDTFERVADHASLAQLRDYATVTRTREEIQGEASETALELGTVHQQAVRFQRDTSAAAWKATYADPESQADPEALKDLRPTPLFRGFLPPDADVAVGAEWSADLDAWREVLHPTGLVVFQDQSGAAADDSIDRKIEAALRGTIECTLTEFAADTGLATIMAKLKLESEATFEGALDNPDPKITTSAYERKIDYTGDLTVMLIWDTQAHRAQGFSGYGEADWTITERTHIYFDNGTDWQQGRRMQMHANHLLLASIRTVELRSIEPVPETR